jgi:hypothetical protein
MAAEKILKYRLKAFKTFVYFASGLFLSSTLLRGIVFKR